MKNKIFRPRKLSKTFVCIVAVCLAAACYACHETGQWTIPLPLLPPIIIALLRQRIRYIIREDGRVEIRSAFSKAKVLDELHQAIYYPRNWLNNRIRINYQNTFELLDPEQPREFLDALRHCAPHLKIEEK